MLHLADIGVKKDKKLFKNPFAQFVKIDANMTKVWSLSEKSSVAAHVNVGTLWAYGNSRFAPYTEQFYVGGANSIRAFNVRQIGPGRYRSTQRRRSYVEQTGDIKFQMQCRVSSSSCGFTLWSPLP